MFSLSSLENHVLASPAVFHLQLLGAMHMLPCFIVVLPFESGPCIVQRYSNMCSLSSDLFTIKPKDHRLVQIKEMTE